MSGMKDMLGDELYVPREPHQLTRAADPQTSFAAGAAVVDRLRDLQRKVYDVHLANPGGLTDLELEARCGSHGSTYRTRRAELVELGLIRDSGRKRHLNGRWRVVWEVKRD